MSRRWPMLPPITRLSQSAIQIRRRSRNRLRRSFVWSSLAIPAATFRPARRVIAPDRAVPIETPILAEQGQEYIVRQLKLYASGERRNDVYGRMRIIAAKLTPGEIDGLAAYYRAGFR